MPSLVIDGRAASLAERSYADFHGHSVFTTMRSKDKEPLLWSRHWQRLCAHASFFGFAVPPEQQIYRLLTSELAQKGVDQKIRIILAANRFAIACEPYEPPTSAIYSGVSVVISAMQVHPQLARYKTGNSLPYALAFKEAEKKGAFEALLCNNDDFVVDGSRTSIMLFDGETLTSLSGGLDGCMREQALEYARKRGVKIEQRLVKRHELSGHMLLANSLIGVVPVGAVNCDFIANLVSHFRMDSNCD